MKRERSETYLECDGCGYSLGKRYATLAVPWHPDALEFHFHPPQHDAASRDCIRYWAIGTGIMKHSLEARGLPAADIEMFLAQLSYRESAAQ